MEHICRLCLSVLNKDTCESISNSVILSTLSSCLFIEITTLTSLPDQACYICVQKINDMQTFRNKIIENQDTLNNYLNKGINDLCNFYNSVLNNYNIKEEVKTASVNDNKENDNINLSNTIITNEIFADNSFHFHNDNETLEDINHYSSEDDLTLSIISSKGNDKSKKCKLKVKKNGIIKKKENKVDEKHAHDTGDDVIKRNSVIETKNIIIQPKYKCLTCFILFNTQNELLQHYNSDHKTPNQDEFIEASSYVTSKVDDKIVFKCSKCDRKYDNKRAINRHMIAHVDTRPFICKICGRTYKTASEIIRHGRAHSGLKMECSHHCGYSTVYLGALKEHERRHSTEFKYKCDKCDKGFNVKTWYLEHQNVHNGVKPFVCNLCGQAFHMSRYLTTHKSSVHPQSSALKRYVCVHCSLPCDTRNALSEHLKIHGIRTSYLCDTCGKTLSNAEQLKHHKLVHSDVKPYTCSTCNKSFTKKFNLKLHERTHTGVKSYECAPCGKQYTQRSTLLRHNNRHHSGTLQKSTKGIKTENEAVIR